MTAPSFGSFSSNDESVFARRRREMVEVQLVDNGISDPRVLAALGEVPRHQFVAEEYLDRAYDSRPWPIGHEQTISQPYTVAFMMEALQLKGHEKVLEIGTGSGYGAAILSLLAREVHTIERIPELANTARGRLARLGYKNLTVHLGDGTLGLPEHAPFDAIVATAAGRQAPPALLQQLAEGGRLVMPVGDPAYDQSMLRITRRGERWETENLGEFAFVPLIGKYGEPEVRAS